MKAFQLASSGNLVTPKGRISYPYLLTANPKAKTPDGKLKFTVSILLPPDCDLTLAKQEVQRVAHEHFGDKLKDEFFRKSLRLPFLDAYEKTKGDEQFRGWTMLRLASVNKPQIVGPDARTYIDEPHEIYAGRWAQVSISAFAYPKGQGVDHGNKGVSFGLQNVQLLDHDEPLAGGYAKATDEFAPVEAVGGGGSAGAAGGAASVFD